METDQQGQTADGKVVDLDQAVRDVMRSSTEDFVHHMDRMQCDPAYARKCPQSPKKCKSGGTALGVHASGAWLICGTCEHREAITREDAVQYDAKVAADREVRRLAELAAAPPAIEAHPDALTLIQ